MSALRALDSPQGPRVEVLALTREGYCHVRSLKQRITFETLASRLHKIA